jgi:hypothetical protein
MPHDLPISPFLFDHLSNIWQGLQMKFLIMQSSVGMNFSIRKWHLVVANFSFEFIFPTYLVSSGIKHGY